MPTAVLIIISILFPKMRMHCVFLVLKSFQYYQGIDRGDYSYKHRNRATLLIFRENGYIRVP